MIVQGAHAIRRGEEPDFPPAEGMRRDLFLIERADPLQARAEIVLAGQRAPAGALRRRSDRRHPGVRAGLPRRARDRCAQRGAAGGTQSRWAAGSRRAAADRRQAVMTGRNLHELGLMNGTLLRLLDETGGGAGGEAALLLSGDESIFRLPPEESESLRLAYACSVHRGQGIELPIAMIVAHPGGRRLLPAPRDALHRGHARQARDRDRRHA